MQLTFYQYKLKEAMKRVIDDINDKNLQCPEKTMAFIAIFNPAYEWDIRGFDKTFRMVSIWLDEFDKSTSYYSGTLCNAFRGASEKNINMLFKANRSELLKLANYSIQGFTVEDIERIHKIKV